MARVKQISRISKRTQVQKAVVRTKETSKRNKTQKKAAEIKSPRKLQRWELGNMNKAIDDVDKGLESRYSAARKYGLPPTTLRRRFEKCVRSEKVMGRKPVLPVAAEAALVNVILDACARGFPLTVQRIRAIVYDYCVVNSIPNNFNVEKRQAGWDWWQHFRERHQQLAERASENLSLARAKGMNRQRVGDFFVNAETHLRNAGAFDAPDRIWNMDETGVQTVALNDRVVAEKGAKTVQSIGATEKGVTSTVVACCNASGMYIPPFVIHPQTKKEDVAADLLTMYPPGTVVHESPTKKGYIQSDLFIEWTKHFLKYIPMASPEAKHVIFLDGHGSHVYNLPAIRLAQSNNVEMLCLPSHTSNWLQPLDRCVFRPFKSNWGRRIHDYTRGCFGERGINVRRVFGRLLSQVWIRAMTPSNAVSAFLATGLCPFNAAAVPDEAYIPSEHLLSNLPNNDAEDEADDGTREAAFTSEMFPQDNTYGMFAAVDSVEAGPSHEHDHATPPPDFYFNDPYIPHGDVTASNSDQVTYAALESMAAIEPPPSFWYDGVASEVVVETEPSDLFYLAPEVQPPAPLITNSDEQMAESTRSGNFYPSPQEFIEPNGHFSSSEISPSQQQMIHQQWPERRSQTAPTPQNDVTCNEYISPTTAMAETTTFQQLTPEVQPPVQLATKSRFRATNEHLTGKEHMDKLEKNAAKKKGKENAVTKKKQAKPKKVARKAAPVQPQGQWQCNGCGRAYYNGDPNEWIQCSDCDEWEHAACEGRLTKRFFICTRC